MNEIDSRVILLYMYFLDPKTKKYHDGLSFGGGMIWVNHLVNCLVCAAADREKRNAKRNG